MSQNHEYPQERHVDCFGLTGENPGYRSFDRVAHQYDSSRFLPPEIQRAAAEAIVQLGGLRSADVLLDAGVGTGRFAVPVSRLGTRVVGVDISTEMMRQLRSKLEASEETLRLVRGDLRHLPFADRSFGAALVVHILHLIADWQAVVEEIRRVLKPGAPLLLAQEAGRRMPTRETYFQLARLRGAALAHLGAANADVVREHLVAQGADVKRRDADRFQWTMRIPVRDTLEMLRQRTWSHLWEVPEPDHAEVLEETEHWALKRYGSLDAVEEATADLKIWVVRWPET